MWIHEPLARCTQKPHYKCYSSNQSRMCEPIDHSTFPTSGNSEFHTRMCFGQLAFPIRHCCAHGVLFWNTQDVAWKHWPGMYIIENRLISNLQDETGSNPASDETVFIANFIGDWIGRYIPHKCIIRIPRKDVNFMHVICIPHKWWVEIPHNKNCIKQTIRILNKQLM